jgi:acetylornithine deacetylase/succinyl-diaminopimelate desuccinylase-like protein
MSNPAASLYLLDEYIRIPTVSSEITAETVSQVQAFWARQGLNFELLNTDFPKPGKVQNPALFAAVPADVAEAPTILLYGHWDVQPTGDLDKWQWAGYPCPPFEPTYFLEDRFLGSDPATALANISSEELDAVKLVARGAADNKGQHLANILGVLQAKQAGKLAWNVKIILDGEEEVGSPNLWAIVQAHRDKLAADFMVGSDGPKSDNRPTLLLGVRGLLAVTIRCDNGTGRMLHSGNYGNVTPNPALPLAHLLEEMAGAVKEIGEAQSQFRAIIDRYFGNDPERARYQPFLWPYFNVNSFMTQGATAGQRRTIIPSWAEASVDVRLIPGLSPEEVYKTLEALTEKANAEVAAKNLKFTIEMGSSCAASFTAPDREGFAWLRKVVEGYWGDDIRLIPILGGTLPNDAFTDGLGLAAYWLPAANSNNRQHDTNEHFILEHYFRQQDFYARLVTTPYE